jgi:hypothetical protein
MQAVPGIAAHQKKNRLQRKFCEFSLEGSSHYSMAWQKQNLYNALVP